MKIDITPNIFNIANTLLGRCSRPPLLEHDSTPELANDFNSCFINKVAKIHVKIQDRQAALRKEQATLLLIWKVLRYLQLNILLSVHQVRHRNGISFQLPYLSSTQTL